MLKGHGNQLISITEGKFNSFCSQMNLEEGII